MSGGLDALPALACVTRHVPLAGLTWYQLGGPARFLAEPQSSAELADVVRACRDTGVALLPLGKGANLLVADAGVDACVLRLRGDAWQGVTFEELPGGRVDVTAGAGVDLFALVRRLADAGVAGLECMAGIPGTVGGAIAMNAGGRYGDVGSRVGRVNLVTSAGTAGVRTRDDLGFAYRRCRLSPGDVVTSATFKLWRDEPAEVRRRTRDVWDYKRDSQPPMGAGGRSAGCAFSNPPGDAAGRLIDAAGCKGLRVGGAEVSGVHANFIIARDGCRSDDVSRLMDEVRRRVLMASGVALEPEVRRWPPDTTYAPAHHASAHHAA